MTTIPTTPRTRVPFWAAIASAAALVVGGVLGVAVEHINNPPAQGQPGTATSPEPPSVDPLTFDPDPGEHRNSAIRR